MNTERREFLRSCAGAGAALVAQTDTRAASGWRADFPALRGTSSIYLDSVYLDSAATTHRPQAVIDAQARFYTESNANPSRVHAAARRAAECLSDARATVARFINAADPLEVIFTRGTTEAVNLAASSWGGANLTAGDEVIVTVAEHASNLMPWTAAARRAGATLRVVDVDDEGHLRLDQLRAALSRRTRVVAFSHVSNVLGIVNPAREICRIARDAGARVFIDGAQGAPHVRVDVQDVGCDFYAFSGHKMAGPMGVGVLWGRRELLDAMPPYHVGSNMAHDVDVERATYEHGALKFQAGTPDVAGPVGLAAAIRYIDGIGRDALWAHDEALVDRARKRLRAIPGVTLIGGLDARPRVPVFAFTVKGVAVSALTETLDRQGLALRGGDLAALPLLRRFGVTQAARASAYLYTGLDDIDRLAGALEPLSR